MRNLQVVFVPSVSIYLLFNSSKLPFIPLLFDLYASDKMDRIAVCSTFSGDVCSTGT
jgi:hypothetical protein